MFERPHHRRIAGVLQRLDADLLAAHACLFGGGTAMALRFGEYRESVDIDVLVSDLGHYRRLRLLLTGHGGLSAVFRQGAEVPAQQGELRADQYGIRARLLVEDRPIKFEIVHEARIALAPPGPADRLCGIATLVPLDMAATKLLANSDRWADDGVFSRDLIDLAMMQPPAILFRQALAKAEAAYGVAVSRDLRRAIERMAERPGWLERCVQAMGMEAAPAQLWQRIRRLRRVLAMPSA